MLISDNEKSHYEYNVYIAPLQSQIILLSMVAQYVTVWINLGLLSKLNEALLYNKPIHFFKEFWVHENHSWAYKYQF